jgi:imidazolonepropionase-like amidohydrolase
MAKAVLGIAALLAAAVPVSDSLDLAIRHARIVHGDGRVTPLATILVDSGRVARIDESAATDGVPARYSIDAAGRTVVPGLIDAHVALPPSTLAPFLANGVTTLREMRSAIDGPGSTWVGATIVDDFTTARAAVRRLVDGGADLIATGPRLKPPIFAIVVQEAAARGVPVAAVLGFTTAVEAAAFGVTSIEHLSGIIQAATAFSARLMQPPHPGNGIPPALEEWTTMPQEALDRVARSLIDRGVTLVPTLVRQEAMLRANDASLGMGGSLAAQQRFVANYARTGGRIAAGTDAGNALVAPGTSLHRELELYVEGGLSPAAALKAATADAAALLGVTNRVGTIAIGRDADLVLVDGDPLRDITALRRIVNVVRRGVVVR